MPMPRVSERTFYPALMEAIRLRGGQGVQEVQFNSVPDILFELGGHSWLMSVKIGESPAIIKEALLQYLRHKEECDEQRFGMLLLLPKSLRRVQPVEDAVRSAIEQHAATAEYAEPLGAFANLFNSFTAVSGNSSPKKALTKIKRFCAWIENLSNVEKASISIDLKKRLSKGSYLGRLMGLISELLALSHDSTALFIDQPAQAPCWQDQPRYAGWYFSPFLPVYYA